MTLRWEDKLELTDIPHPSAEEYAEKLPPVQEVSVSALEYEKACKNSMDFLGGAAMPEVFRYFFPPVFKQVWSLLLSKVNLPRDFTQLALGLPRGFGKTMVIKLFILYCILFTKKQFILIICGTEPKAKNVLSDIISMLEEPNIVKIFGDWRIGKEVDQQILKKFSFRGRSIILAAAGAKSDIRGITLNNERPDIMIFDDIQTRLDADSEVVSTQLETWMIGTAIKAKSPHGCLFIFIANMYPTPFSLLRRLKKNNTWIKFIAGGILTNSKNEPESLWEDLQPLRQLLAEYENDLAMGHPEIFHSEVLNDENAAVNNSIDITKIPQYPFDDTDIPAGKFIVIDPATDKDRSDYVSIGYCEIHMEKPYLIEVFEDRLSPLAIIEKALEMGFRHNCRFITCEADAFQYSLLYWFTYITQQRGFIGFEFEPVYSGGKNKISTILAMFQQLLKGEIGYHPRCHGPVVSQIVSFNPLKNNNTDGILDLLKYMPKVLELYGTSITAQSVITLQESAIEEVLSYNSPF